MNPHYLLVAARANHRCEYCLAPEAIFNFYFEVEHIHPSSLEGTNDFSNLALACRSCNLFKAKRVVAFDVVGDADQSGGRGRQQQRADRRVDGAVGHVEHAGAVGVTL